MCFHDVLQNDVIKQRSLRAVQSKSSESVRPYGVRYAGHTGIVDGKKCERWLRGLDAPKPESSKYRLPERNICVL